MRIVLVGFGSVGKNFFQLLQMKNEELANLYGVFPKVVAVVDNGGAVIDPVQLDYQSILDVKETHGSVAYLESKGHLGMNALKVINEVDADVLIEASSTNFKNAEPALSHIISALKKQVHVITTNKAPLAIAMPALMELATYNQVLLRFSGTVGGGTPFLDFAKTCLIGNKIRSIRGILNGTTNYILNRMFHAGLSMQEALIEAQKKGYAETDPTNDIDGTDTACKLVILANWVIGLQTSLENVRIEGVSRVKSEQVRKAKNKGNIIKLIGTVEDRLSVKPMEIPIDHPLNVAGALNSVVFNTELAGEITLIGKGAGGIETASAVLKDLIEIKKASMRLWQ